MADSTADTYSRDTLKDRTIPFMILSDGQNPLTAPITRRAPGGSILEPSEIARLRFAVRGNAIGRSTDVKFARNFHG